MVQALPMMNGQSQLNGLSGLPAVAFALPPADHQRVRAGKRLFVTGGTIVEFAKNWADLGERQSVIRAVVFERLLPAQPSPEEVAVYGGSKDGSEQQKKRLHVLGHNRGLLALLALLPADTTPPKKLADALPNITAKAAKEVDEDKKLRDDTATTMTVCEICDDGFDMDPALQYNPGVNRHCPKCTASAAAAATEAGAPNDRAKDVPTCGTAELAAAASTKSKAGNNMDVTTMAAGAAAGGTGAAEVSAPKRRKVAAEAAANKEEEAGRAVGRPYTRAAAKMRNNDLGKATQPSGRGAKGTIRKTRGKGEHSEGSGGCNGAGGRDVSSGPLPGRPATQPPPAAAAATGAADAGRSGGLSGAASCGRQGARRNASAAADNIGADVTAWAPATAVLGQEEGEEDQRGTAPASGGAAASYGPHAQPAPALLARRASGSPAHRCGSATSAACACDRGQLGECGASDTSRTPPAAAPAPPPVAALELLSPVGSSGSSAARAAAQRQGGCNGAGGRDVSSEPLPGRPATQPPPAAAAATGAADAGRSGTADNVPDATTTPQRVVQHPEPQWTMPKNRVAPLHLTPVFKTPNAKMMEHEERYDKAAKAVVGVVLGVVAAAEEQQGPTLLGPGFYLTATAVLLLILVLLHGLEDPCTQPWVKPGIQTIEELVTRLQEWATIKGLNLDTCIRFVWAGAPDWPKVAQTLAAVKKGIDFGAINKGSYNGIFEVVGRGDLLTRLPRHNGHAGMMSAVYEQGPALLRHLRAACRVHIDNQQPIGVRVMGLLPVVNGRVPDLTTGEALRSLCAAKGKVAVAMVLERLTTVEEAAQALAAYTVARGPWQEGVWPLGLQLALTRSVLSATGRLTHLGLHHGDIKADNVGFTDLKQQPFREATFLDNDDLSQELHGETHHTTRCTALKTERLLDGGNKWFRPCLRLQGMNLHAQVQSFQAALLVLLLPEAVLYHANGGCLVDFEFTPAVWDTGHGGLGVLYPSQLMSAVLAGVLGTLMHPLADKRKGLQELMPRVHSLYSAMDECGFCLRGFTDAGCLRVPIGAQPLAHLCSPPQTDVLLGQLLSALEEWREAPFMEPYLRSMLEQLYTTAHCTWPAGPVNDFMQRVLLLAVLCDIVRVERQAEAGLERLELLLYKGEQGDGERTLLHLLGATGNTQAYITVLRALAISGLRYDKYHCVLNAVDKNGYSPLMLAAVHGQHALVMAHIGFTKERLDEEAQQLLKGALSPDLHELSEAAVIMLLDGLVAEPAALGGLLTILCSQFNEHNDQLQKLLAYVPPVLRLPEVAGGQGGGASSSRAGGEAAAGALLAAAHAHLGAVQEKLEQALEASRLQPLLFCLREPVQPAAGQEAGPHIVEQVARGALKLFATAIKLPLTDPHIELIRDMTSTFLMAKTARELGGNTPFHAAAAMAGPLPGLYAAVEETFGCELADNCLAEVNEDGRTPLQVLLQCHPVAMSAPSRAFEKVDDNRTEGRAKLAVMTAGLRDFLEERGEDAARSLQAEVDMEVADLLRECWS